MNKASNFLKYLKKYQRIQQSNFIIQKKLSINYSFRNYANEKELKNKEINRNKKQKSWMKKICVKELPKKKFGNQLGSMAKKEYLRYLCENKEHQIHYDKLHSYEKNYIFNVMSKEKNNKENEKNNKVNKKNDITFDNNGNNNTCSNSDKLSSKNEQIYKQLETKINVRAGEKNEIALNSSNNSISEEYVNDYNKVFWDDVSNELKYHLPFLQPYSITMALNYLSKINYDEYSIFKLIAKNIDERWIKNFNIKDLTLLLLSYSRLNLRFDSFINLISRELLYKICYANFEDLSNIAYSFTKMKIYDYEVFLHLGNEAKDKIRNEMSKFSDNNKNNNTDKYVSLIKEKKNEDFKKECVYNQNYEEDNSLDEINRNTVDNENTMPNIELKYNKSKWNNERYMVKMNTLNKEENEKKINQIKEDKKFSHLCLLVYCFGKVRHCDNNLFELVSEYVDFEKLNNIDLSNLSYTFSLYNIYKDSFYEKFSAKSCEIIDLLEPLQKIIIITYLLKHPQEKMISTYFIYLENVSKEIKKKQIYKETLFLNVCINSLSSEIFLNFLSKIGKDSESIFEQRVEEINRVCFMLNFLVDYTSFFMQNKNKMSSRDYPRILNILLKIYDIKDNFLLFRDSIKIEKVEFLLSDTLDKIENEIKNLHILDLIRIKNILNSKYEKIKFGQKIRTIINSVSLFVK